MSLYRSGQSTDERAALDSSLVQAVATGKRRATAIIATTSPDGLWKCAGEASDKSEAAHAATDALRAERDAAIEKIRQRYAKRIAKASAEYVEWSTIATELIVAANKGGAGA